MTALAQRKRKLIFETAAEVRYRGRFRPVIVEPDAQGFTVAVRLKGTRTRYEGSWEGVFQHFGKLAADRARAERKQKRLARRSISG